VAQILEAGFKMAGAQRHLMESRGRSQC